MQSSLGAFALLASLVTPAALSAQGRDLGACSAVATALNPADPMHPDAANASAARTALGQCGASGSPSHQLSLALIEATAGRHEAVLAAVAPVLAADPDNRYALRFRCHALASTSRAAEALPLCDRALAPAPDWAPGHHSRGWALSQLGRRADAIAALQRATTLQPLYAFSWNNLAAFQGEAGLQAAALGGYQRARALLPRDSLVWRNIGRTLVQLKEYARGAATFDSVLARHPGYALAWFERADLEQRRDRPVAARPFVERALAIDPKQADALVLRGELRLIDKDLQGALADYRAAAVAAPRWAEPPYRLARTLRQTAGCADARNALVDAFALAPEWDALADELRDCGADQRAMLATMNAVTARTPSRLVASLRAQLPDSVHPPAAQVADWNAVLAGSRDSSTPRALQAWRGRGRALLVDRRPVEALAAFTQADEWLRRSTASGYPVDFYRREVTAALAVLHAEHGDPAASQRMLAALDAETSRERANADSVELATFGQPIARLEVSEGALAYALRALGADASSPADVGLALLRRGMVRGADLLVRERPTPESLAAFAALVRGGQVRPAAFRAQVEQDAGRPGDGRLLRDGVDPYSLNLGNAAALNGEVDTYAFAAYTDARFSLAAERRRVAGLYLLEAWKTLGRSDRALRLSALEFLRDRAFAPGGARGLDDTRALAKDGLLSGLLFEDLGYDANEERRELLLCSAGDARMFRLTRNRSRLGTWYVEFGFRRSDGLWVTGRVYSYDPTLRRLPVEIAPLSGQFTDDFTLDGVLATGGTLRGRTVALQLCR